MPRTAFECHQPRAHASTKRALINILPVPFHIHCLCSVEVTLYWNLSSLEQLLERFPACRTRQRHLFSVSKIPTPGAGVYSTYAQLHIHTLKTMHTPGIRSLCNSIVCACPSLCAVFVWVVSSSNAICYPQPLVSHSAAGPQ